MMIISGKSRAALLLASLTGAVALGPLTLLPNAYAEDATTSIIAPQAGFSVLAAKVMPSVVSVKVKFAEARTPDTEVNPAMPDLPEDSPFREFFKRMPGKPQQKQQRRPRGSMAQGSGFFISADGYIVTNNHVLENADTVSVTMEDGSEYDAKVIGTDPKTDLALIKVDAGKPFEFVRFASQKPKVGDWVLAVGNPFGLGGTVTTGIVSALGRDIGSGPYDDFMQIDASINHGNSGGPAFDLNGDVVGINTAIFSPSGGSVGIGFAIPANMAKDVIASLKDNGAVTRGWLGVQIQPVSADLAESLGLKDAKGALVADVTEGSPAAKAGFKTGDTIIEVDGATVDDARDLSRKVAQVKPGANVDMLIVRGGKQQTLSVAIGTMPSGTVAQASAPVDNKKVDVSSLGLKVAAAEDGAGVRIVAVEPGSAAEAQGIEANDIIVELGGVEVQSPRDLEKALGDKAESKEKIVILLKNSGGQRFVALPVKKRG